MPRLKFPLVGSNVLIRKLYKKDIPALYDLESDPAVKEYVGGPVQKPKDEWVTLMRKLTNSRTAILPFSVLDNSTGDYIGRATISVNDHTLRLWEIQILIAKRYWGKRLGREVCEILMTALYDVLDAQSVMATIHPDNKVSRALVEAFGFVHVDEKRCAGWQYGHLIYKHQQTAT